MAADDSLSSTVADLRSRHYSVTLPTGEPVCYSDRHAWPCHADRALRAVEAVLKQVADRESKAEECRAFAARKLEHGNAITAWIAEAKADAFEDCAQALREAIARELLGEGGDDA